MVTKRYADSISTTVCRTGPPTSCRLAPRARLDKPEARAHRCSASAVSRLAEEPSSEAVRGQHHRVPRGRHPLHQVVQQPVEICVLPCRLHQASLSVTVGDSDAGPVPGGESGGGVVRSWPGSVTRPAARRPRAVPACNADMTRRASSGLRGVGSRYGPTGPAAPPGCRTVGASIPAVSVVIAGSWTVGSSNARSARGTSAGLPAPDDPGVGSRSRRSRPGRRGWSRPDGDSRIRRGGRVGRSSLGTGRGVVASTGGRRSGRGGGVLRGGSPPDPARQAVALGRLDRGTGRGGRRRLGDRTARSRSAARRRRATSGPGTGHRGQPGGSGQPPLLRRGPTIVTRQSLRVGQQRRFLRDQLGRDEHHGGDPAPRTGAAAPGCRAGRPAGPPRTGRAGRCRPGRTPVARPAAVGLLDRRLASCRDRGPRSRRRSRRPPGSRVTSTRVSAGRTTWRSRSARRAGG